MKTLMKAAGTGTSGAVVFVIAVWFVADAASGPILRRAVRLALARRTRDEWLARIDRSVVPIAPILTPREAMEDAQLSLRMSEAALGPLVPALTMRPVQM